jgi:hypothetical protein
METQSHREHRGYDFVAFRLESREHRTIQGLDGPLCVRIKPPPFWRWLRLRAE